MKTLELHLFMPDANKIKEMSIPQAQTYTLRVIPKTRYSIYTAVIGYCPHTASENSAMISNRLDRFFRLWMPDLICMIRAQLADVIDNLISNDPEINKITAIIHRQTENTNFWDAELVDKQCWVGMDDDTTSATLQALCELDKNAMIWENPEKSISVDISVGSEFSSIVTMSTITSVHDRLEEMLIRFDKIKGTNSKNYRQWILLKKVIHDIHALQTFMGTTPQ